MAKQFTRITTTETPADRKRRETARRNVQAEFPPKQKSTTKVASSVLSIGYAIREARTAQGLTWYAVAKQAGIPNSGTVRAIEEGRDAKLSSVEAIAKVLGLRLAAVAP
jgi:ribosome-binding protein aMBF1 (putative translation factor)